MKFTLFSFLLLFAIDSFAQSEMDVNSSKKQKEEYFSIKRMAVTAGFLYGGGALIGVDVERKLSKHFGAQVGVGFVGYGAGINYHHKAFERSFFSLQFWNQGTGVAYVQSLVGPTYNIRWKFLAAQIGFGFIADKGPLFDQVYVNGAPLFVLLYSAGIFKAF